MSAIVRGSSSAQGGNTFTIPAATAAGDMIFLFMQNIAGSTIPVPTGYTNLVDRVTTGGQNNSHCALQYKVATAGDAGATYNTGTLVGSTPYDIVLCLVIAGTVPFTTVTSNITTADAITTSSPPGTVDPSVITKHFTYHGYMYQSPSGTTSVPTGYTQIQGLSGSQNAASLFVKTVNEPANTTSTDSTNTPVLASGVAMTLQIQDAITTYNAAAALSSGTSYLVVPNTIIVGALNLLSGTPTLLVGATRIIVSTWTRLTGPIAQWVKDL